MRRGRGGKKPEPVADGQMRGPRQWYPNINFISQSDQDSEQAEILLQQFMQPKHKMEIYNQVMPTEFYAQKTSQKVDISRVLQEAARKTEFEVEDDDDNSDNNNNNDDDPEEWEEDDNDYAVEYFDNGEGDDEQNDNED